MKQLTGIRKTKEKKLFEIVSINEFQNFDFNKYIPRNASNIQIYFNTKEKLLKLDYLIDLKDIKGEDK